jgi:aspartyl-tRNA(Asn)/glutamyl-tRNA(Gln) amidotransferase subunit A
VCGLVGLKPAMGEIPIDGVVPLSILLDHVGPMCRSVEDAALLYQILRGSATPMPIERRPLRGLRLGIPRPYFMALLDPQIAARFDDACRRLSAEGVALEDVVIPHAAEAAPVYLHLVLPEAAAYHAPTLDSRPDDYSPNVRLRLEMGRYILAEDYVRALLGREALIKDVNAALGGRDGLFLPTMPVAATKLGAATVSIGGVEEPVRNAMLRLTQVFNITGHPAITLPCGRTNDNLPVGAQLVGERTPDLLAIAAAIEHALE